MKVQNYSYLLTLEALYIRDLKPYLSTKDECRNKELIIKISVKRHYYAVFMF